MSLLGAIITQAIVHHYGRDEFLQRLSHPFWFQSFGAVMGMDWHSSGITTSVIGALKRGLGPLQSELGIHVCGGRGQHSRKTPDELRVLADRVGFDGNKLTRASRLVAKVDCAALQDGFDLCLHGFVVTDDGKWTVVQQGMNGQKKQARRYHWHSETLRSFIDEPHSAIDGQPQNEIVNLAGSFDKLDINHRIPIRPSNLTHLNDARRANSILASVQRDPRLVYRSLVVLSETMLCQVECPASELCSCPPCALSTLLVAEQPGQTITDARTWRRTRLILEKALFWCS